MGIPTGNDTATNQSLGTQQQKGNDILYQTISSDYARIIIDKAVTAAERRINIGYTKENWNLLFGEDRKVSTPIGIVIVGKHQYEKLAAKGRADIVGMIKPTLEKPSFILRESGGSNDGNDAYNFIKVFKDDNGNRWLFSVVISNNDGLYVISSRGIHERQVAKLLTENGTNSLAYVATDNQWTPSSVQHRELTGRPTNNLPSEQTEVNDIEASDETLRQKEIENEEYREIERRYKDTDQWMKAPNGKPTNLTERQWVQVRTPSFIKWFGDWINNPDNASKVVDENGEPLVMYHGTRASFDVFDTSYEGEDRKEYESAWMADYPDGTMFAISDRKEASYYGSNVMPLFLNIREKEMKASSFAEAINFMDNGDASFSDTVIKVYKDNDWRDDPREFEGAIVAFHNSNDAKSATDNIGTFDSNNDNIRLQTAYHGSPYGFDEFSSDKVN